MGSLLKRLYEWTEPIRVICAWMITGFGLLLTIVAIVAFPAVMCVHYSCLWLLGYVGYMAVAYFMYELFVK